MGPKKAKAKSGGKRVRPPPRPAPVSDSSDEDCDMGTVRALIARLEALEKKKQGGAAAAEKGGPSGIPASSRSITRGAKRTKLIQSLSSRLDALESREPCPTAPAVDLTSDGDGAQATSETCSRDTRPSAPLGPERRAARARVLILGHSIVFWAHKAARVVQPGTQLGLGQWADISWIGRRGMVIAQFLPMLQEFLAVNPPPDILVLHLGENDLGSKSGLSIFHSLRKDILLVLEWCPGILILWSAMLQRRVWRGARDTYRVERARRKVTAQMARFVAAIGGGPIDHPSILFSEPSLFRGDGVHLSPSGTSSFLRELEQGLAVYLRSWWGGSG
ncbi:uncharacterized protein LOC128327873 [Hemicordylus capensis]|uniref:uncharacterized protein LOC128327873 n=1 Tax=Hemicordylus capensis TaxID=884348 RepID=UPI002303A3E4|nr:uncharacterized protein LOC128327873 [Hemicordylus capensis]